MTTINLPSSVYSDIQLPSKGQLRQLSRRALVAFVCRCVRRVQRFYSSGHSACVETLENTLQAAEAYARGEKFKIDGPAIHFMVKYARNQGSRYVAQAASYLAYTTLFSARCRDEEDLMKAVDRAWMAIATAYNADPDLSYVFAAREDFDYLIVIAGDQVYEAGDAVEAGEAGAMGPLWTGAA